MDRIISLLLRLLSNKFSITARIRCRGKVFTEPLLSSGQLFRLLRPSNGFFLLRHDSGFQSSYHNIYTPSPLTLVSVFGGVHFTSCLTMVSEFMSSVLSLLDKNVVSTPIPEEDRFYVIKHLLNEGYYSISHV